ncbi:hypothetical protein SQ03_10375 [Methylobacterium platani JCM 14648]|uniref:HTH lysR-type domain-containing protein n=2 Tax=Methylobacterium platani TaxID=427683 RepID=A0A179S5T6_9HYPH|nr:hypothetical protein SQ03_10375 [Methylobacterium platani JCM 14648]OAS20277.1 hypothetical protein A5481_22610 [Methylobacterium platani]
MDTAFLDSLVGVIEGGSIAAAARRQGISPAAVALRLQALESEFGRPLVTRSGRTVVATEAGARILAQARALLRAVDDLKGLATGEGMIGQLRLGVIASAASGLLTPVLRRFEAAHPGSRLLIQRGVSSALFHAVVHDALDAALIVEPDFQIPKTCAWTRLDVEPLVLLTPRALGGGDPHAILAREPLIRYGRSHWGGGLADAYLQRAGIVPCERYELDALDSIATLVAQGLGVALVPDWVGLRRLADEVAKHALPQARLERRIGILWSRSTVRVRHVQALAACASEVIGDLRTGAGA